MATLQRKARIHQYHSGSAKGDAVTNGMLYTRGILRELGFDSNIYCSHLDPQLGSELLHISEWNDATDLLLVHHSIGIDDEPWLTSTRCRKVLVYHNITPAHFFSDQPDLAKYVRLGFDQLQRWQPMFEAVVADSELNKSDLIEFGYDESLITVIPLLLDIEALRSIVPDEATLAEHEPFFNVVFVGRLVENKRQHDIVDAYARSHVRRERPSQLIFVGGTTSEGYVGRIREEAQKLGVADELTLTGKISSSELSAIYRAADVFVCLSEHEGFGVPIVEAMVFDVPIIALARAAVPWTLGQGGILFQEFDPDEVAVAIDFIAQNAALRSRLIEGQRKELARFDRREIKEQLRRVLAKCGFGSDAVSSTRVIGRNSAWRIEGPFDSSYSLAILNRNLGRALLRQGMELEYLSSEGGGDFPADPFFLQANPDIGSRIADPGKAPPDVVLRNMYPPRCTRMDGVVNTYALYGWEESAFPHEWACGFNENLDLITTTSRFVSKALIDSGVKVPVRVVGDGADHFVNVVSEPLGVPLLSGFRFLHNSSCFPRKGIDVLLEAFGCSFSGRADVSLIVKTFPNPHNDIVAQLQRFRKKFPRAPQVQLLMEDLTEGQMATLYASCNALVAPSRGEGFGLPIAEAMLREIPVIATAYSGQMDFCNDDTAYLVDYRFAYARSHFEEPGSIWAEPDVASLGRAMLAVVDGSGEARRSRVANALRVIRYRFSWDAVAERQVRAVRDIREAPLPVLPVSARIAWISTWKTRCGIASYSEFLLQNWDRSQTWILADEQAAAPEGLPGVERCWTQQEPETGRKLLNAALALQADVVVIQYNFSFFPLSALAELIDGLRHWGKTCFLTLHATKDVDKPDFKASLGEIRQSLARCTRILVHSLADCNRLKDIGLVDNVVLFPHGVPAPSGIRGGPRSGKFTVGTFGYALPHKGLREVIDACALLRRGGYDVALRMINSRYPAPHSDEEVAACKSLIASKLGNKDAIFDDDFHSEAEIVDLLAQCDVLIFAYQETGESASGAIRVAMSAGVPILCTPLEIFDDVSAAVDFSTGLAPQALAEAILRFISEPALALAQLNRRSRWQSKTSWPVLSKRLADMIESLTFANRNEAGEREL